MNWPCMWCCMLGVRVTGDHIVPFGNVSFQACSGRRHALGWDLLYPLELSVQLRHLRKAAWLSRIPRTPGMPVLHQLPT